MILKDADIIINFLLGKGTDHEGRTLKDILEFPDEEIEQCHDHIQWIFPLHEKSKFANTYPVLTPPVVQLARKSNKIKNNLIKTKNRMEQFLGIGNYNSEKKQMLWCQLENHNLLRITRIIRSLRIFGLEEEAKDFYNNVVEVGKKYYLPQNTFVYWERALNEDVWESLT